MLADRFGLRIDNGEALWCKKPADRNAEQVHGGGERGGS